MGDLIVALLSRSCRNRTGSGLIGRLPVRDMAINCYLGTFYLDVPKIIAVTAADIGKFLGGFHIQNRAENFPPRLEHGLVTFTRHSLQASILAARKL